MAGALSPVPGTGRKLRRISPSRGRLDYLQTGVAVEGALEFLYTAEGRALPPENVFGAYRYGYQQTDHLGNLRTACRCGVKYANVGGQLTVQNTAPNEDPRTLIQENQSSATPGAST